MTNQSHGLYFPPSNLRPISVHLSIFSFKSFSFEKKRVKLASGGRKNGPRPLNGGAKGDFRSNDRWRILSDRILPSAVSCHFHSIHWLWALHVFFRLKIASTWLKNTTDLSLSKISNFVEFNRIGWTCTPFDSPLKILRKVFWVRVDWIRLWSANLKNIELAARGHCLYAVQFEWISKRTADSMTTEPKEKL